MRLRLLALLMLLVVVSLLSSRLEAKKPQKKSSKKPEKKSSKKPIEKPRNGNGHKGTWRKGKQRKPKPSEPKPNKPNPIVPESSRPKSNNSKLNSEKRQNTITVQSSKVSRKEVQKRFILRLTQNASVKLTKRRVRNLRFHGKKARCTIHRFYAKLRMLSIRCSIVSSPRLAILVDALLNKLPGVLHSTPDALLSARPSDSIVHDQDDGNGSNVLTFQKQFVRMKASDNGDLMPYNWGLDRIDEDYSPLDNLPVDFSCYPNKGEGVRVFIIDTGCKVDHVEFAEAKINTVPAPGSDFTSGTDDHGHGSHIAGVVVGRNVGIARNAEVTCIKAFDKYGNGAATDTISAVEYIIEQKYRNSSVPFVVNLSYSALTGFTNTPLDEIVYAASARGIVFVVSAGNAAVNSCLFSPSKAEQALTVAASTKRDTLESDSNIGPCVEFIAPGHEIVSAGIESNTAYESLNGTSMATPHIVGVSALVLAQFPELQSEPRTVRDNLYQKLVTLRSSNVSNFIMPLMETGCEADTPRAKRTAHTNTSIVEFDRPVPVTALTSTSSSPSASPSWSPFPSASPVSSPSPGHAPEPHSAPKDEKLQILAGHGNKELPPPAPESYYQFGFGPAEDPYLYGTIENNE